MGYQPRQLRGTNTPAGQSINSTHCMSLRRFADIACFAGHLWPSALPRIVVVVVVRGAQVMTLQSPYDVKHWRDRAAEMRGLSEEMKDPKAKVLLLDLADDYDRLADRALDRSLHDEARGPSPIPKNK
jgi:hypothetical protein